MSTRAPHRSTRIAAATTRAITRMSTAVLTSALFTAAVYFRAPEFITAALLTGTAGAALDVRQTTKPAPARAAL